MDDLRYPIGPFSPPEVIDDDVVQRWIDEIEAFPAQLRAAVDGFTEEQFETSYRPGGWTVRQVVHHVGDSHLNSIIRFKWALTEDTPTIKPYFEERWAELPDYHLVPIETSLNFLTYLHARWVPLLRALTQEDLARTFIHPESGVVSVAQNIGLYAWHGLHHLAHITHLKERMGWN